MKALTFIHNDNIDIYCPIWILENLKNAIVKMFDIIHSSSPGMLLSKARNNNKLKSLRMT